MRSPGRAGADPVDVLVVGGGPAGSSVGLALARAGRSVVVLERSRYETTRLGEVLPPEIRLPLVELGVWQQFLEDGHTASPGIASAWGSSVLSDNGFVCNPHGHGWHVDRRRFDATLASTAEAHGVQLLRDARRLDPKRKASDVWTLRADVEGCTRHFNARVLVNATGRAASVARRWGARRIVHDRLAGLVRFVQTHTADQDRRLLVESVEHGWWYSAMLPSGSHIVAFMTDSELLGRQSPSYSLWHDYLQAAPHTRARFAAYELVAEPRVTAANTSRLDCAAGDCWLAVGDAAAALDPLSSQGVYRALVSGLEGARTIDDHLRGVRGAMAKHAHQVRLDFAEDLRLRSLWSREALA